MDGELNILCIVGLVTATATAAATIQEEGKKKEEHRFAHHAINYTLMRVCMSL